MSRSPDQGSEQSSRPWRTAARWGQGGLQGRCGAPEESAQAPSGGVTGTAELLRTSELAPLGQLQPRLPIHNERGRHKD